MAERTALRRITDEHGSELDSTFAVEIESDVPTIVLESRGGSSGSPNERNSEYVRGLDVLLGRLKALSGTLQDAQVETRTTLGMSSAERSLKLKNHAYPIPLSEIEDLLTLRKDLCDAQITIGQKPGAKGGNRTKRIRLYLELPIGPSDPRSIASQLADGVNQSLFEAPEYASVTSTLESRGEFDVTSLADARERIARAIVLRRGQPAFRQRLMKAYNGRCALTGCDVEEALEAAHIIPYRGPDTNHTGNGLLLRSDVHVLFDKGLIAIDTTSWRVILATRLRTTTYSALHNSMLNLPTDQTLCPSLEALNLHRTLAGL